MINAEELVLLDAGEAVLLDACTVWSQNALERTNQYQSETFGQGKDGAHGDDSGLRDAGIGSNGIGSRK